MSTPRAEPGDLQWPALGPAHMARYLFAAAHCRDRRVLDAGCGSGYGAALLLAASAGAAACVAGVDVDGAVISRARGQFRGVDFQVGDCQTLDSLAGPFDIICSFESIEHLEYPERFLAAAAARLAAGGTLLISTPDRAATPPFRQGKPANPYHVTEWDAAAFTELLGEHFTQVDVRMQVESHAHAARTEAIQALRQGLFWSSPMLAFLWRKWGRMGRHRSWNALEALTAPGIADFPIVDADLAPIWGKPFGLLAVCRSPRGR